MDAGDELTSNPSPGAGETATAAEGEKRGLLEYGDRVFIRTTIPWPEGGIEGILAATFPLLYDGVVLMRTTVTPPGGAPITAYLVAVRGSSDPGFPPYRAKLYRREHLIACPRDVENIDWQTEPF